MHYIYNISIKGKYFDSIPIKLDLKLRVVDARAHNSAGVRFMQ